MLASLSATDSKCRGRTAYPDCGLIGSIAALFCQLGFDFLIERVHMHAFNHAWVSDSQHAICHYCSAQRFQLLLKVDCVTHSFVHLCRHQSHPLQVSYRY